MTDPAGLEERLRAALGADGPLRETDPFAARRTGQRSGPAGAKARVLDGIRRRRLRRLQAVGSAAAVALGLAIGLPELLSGSPGHPVEARAGARASASGVPTRHAPPGAHAAFGAAAAAPRAGGPGATCRRRGGAPTGCGVLEEGKGAQRLTRAADAANAPGGVFAAAPEVRGLGAPFVVRAGSTVVVTLPEKVAGWHWARPRIAGMLVYHGSGPPVVVRALKSRRGVQRFSVRTTVAVTVVLWAQEDVDARMRTAQSVARGRWPVWALELEVVGR
jgi:hypothetical protein